MNYIMDLGFNNRGNLIINRPYKDKMHSVDTLS